MHLPKKERGEVPSSIGGKLGDFTFFRAWYYYIVSGPVPLKVAERLYRGPIGKRDVRVAGHCGCPPPSEWVEYFNPATGKKVLDLGQKAEAERFFASKPMHEIGLELMEKYEFAEDPSAVGNGFITGYHIDSQEGLDIFVHELKYHGLV